MNINRDFWVGVLLYSLIPFLFFLSSHFDHSYRHLFKYPIIGICICFAFFNVFFLIFLSFYFRRNKEPFKSLLNTAVINTLNGKPFSIPTFFQRLFISLLGIFDFSFLYSHGFTHYSWVILGSVILYNIITPCIDKLLKEYDIETYPMSWF